MKSEGEIRAKLAELFDWLHFSEDCASDRGARETAEELQLKIDALLWVLGDSSGKPI